MQERKCWPEAFKIPVMDIQSTLLELQDHPLLLSLKAWLSAKVETKRDDWGIEGGGFYVDHDLERRWYPIFVIENRWLADAFVKHLAVDLYQNKGD